MAVACPPRVQLYAFASGRLDDDSAGQLVAHLDDCPVCEADLEEIESGQDAAVLAVGDPAAEPSPVQEPEFLAARARIAADIRAGRIAVDSGSNQPAQRSLPGRIGNYELLEFLAGGGMGDVYRALHRNLNKTVAVKLLKEERCKDAAAVMRFKKEMLAVGKLNHPNIVQTYDAGEVDGRHYLAMEYVEGIDLSRLVKQRGPLPIAEACEIIRQAADALQYAHEHRLVHRDIKPSNLMLALGSRHSAIGQKERVDSRKPMADSPRVKILDFGLARLLSDKPDRDELTRDSQFLGTLDYIAPEQAMSAADADIRADIYSLGATLYKLLTGRAVYSKPQYESPEARLIAKETRPAPAIQDYRKGIPDALAAVIHRMLQREPGARFATPGDVAAAISPFALGADLNRLVEPPVRPRDCKTEEDQNESPELAVDPSIFPVVGSKEEGKPHACELVGERRKPRGLAIASAAGGLLALLLLLAAVFAIPTPQGTITVEIPEQFQRDVTLVVKGGGEEIQVSDQSGWRIKLRPGVYQVALNGSRDEIKVAPNSIVVSRGKDTVVRVTRTKETEPDPLVLPPFVRWLRTDAAKGGAGGIALSGDGTRIYFPYGTDEEKAPPVDVLDAKTRRALASAAFGSSHRGMVVSADNRFLYTTNYDHSVVSRIDLEDQNKVIDLEVGGTFASELYATPDRTKLLVPLGTDGRIDGPDNDQLVIVDIADGKFEVVGRIPLPDEPERQCIAFSTDGKFAYVITRKRKSAAPTLYEISLDKPYKIIRTLGFEGASLTGIAASNTTDQILVSDATNKEVLLIDREMLKKVGSVGLDGHVPGPLASALDGKLAVALCAASKTLCCIDVPQRRMFMALGGLHDDARYLAFSPDQSRLFVAHAPRGADIAVINVGLLINQIAFASDRAGESYQIYVQRADRKEPVRLTDSRSTDRCPRWSPDGERIAFVSDRAGPPRICVTKGDGTEVKVLEKTDAVLSALHDGVTLAWSPSGKEIAFVGDAGRALRIVDAETGEVRTVVEREVAPGLARFTGLSWRRTDGKIITSAVSPASSFRRELFAVDAKTGKAEQLTSANDEGLHHLAPVVSPVGDQIAAFAQATRSGAPRNLVVLGAGGRELRRLTDHAGEDYISPCWLAGSNELVFGAMKKAGYQLNLVNPLAKDVLQFTDSESNNIEPDAFSPLFSAEGGNHEPE